LNDTLTKMNLIRLHIILLLVTSLFIDFSICSIDEDGEEYEELDLKDDEDFIEVNNVHMEIMSGSGDGGEEMPNGHYLLYFSS
jgi:thioredoxin-related protein